MKYLLLICGLLFLAGQEIKGQSPEGKPASPAPVSKTVKLGVEAEYSEEKDKDVIIIQGQTNLPEGILIQVALYASLNLPEDSPAGARGPLVEMVETAVDTEGQFQYRFHDFRISFIPEYYEVEMFISPEQFRLPGGLDKLLAEGFNESELKRVKGYALVNIISSRLLKSREDSAGQLQAQIQTAGELTQQLTGHITTIEKIKIGDSEMEERLKKALGIYKTRRQLLDELGREWLEWGKRWSGAIGHTLKKLEEEKTCLVTVEKISSALLGLQERYHNYQSLAMDKEQKLVDKALSADAFVTPTQSQLTGTFRLDLTKEIAHKIAKDLLNRVNYLLTAFEKYCPPSPDEHQGAWDRIKKEVQEYLSNGLKPEIVRYRNDGLFVLPAQKPEGKNTTAEEYQQIIDLIDLVQTLADKLGARMLNIENQSLQAETEALVNLINQKVASLLNR